MSCLYFLTPTAMTVIAFVGGFTALFAATIALVQNDIKKVLAYSTVSQLGFMVLACGVGAFDAGVFHLLTHACFKALLFLGAGSVIVAMHHKQDIQEMGGLSKYLPITYKVFLIGVLAIIGFPGLSGFFSKDEILWRAFIFPQFGSYLWSIAMLAAICTAFYMVRLLCLTFYGKNRSDKHTREHLHETPALMWAPLVVLAVLSALIGYLGVPEFLAHLFGGSNVFASYLHSMIHVPEEGFWSFAHHHHSESLEWTMMLTSTILSMSSAGLSYFLYRNGPNAFLSKLSKSLSGVYNLLLNKYWIDEIYIKLIVHPLRDMSNFLWRIVDIGLINGCINFLGSSLMFLSSVVSLRNTGSMQRYAAIFMVGLIALIYLVIQ